MKRFKVIEDNGGGLTLVVFAENDTVGYVHGGYEFIRGQLSNDLDSLKNGADPSAEWDGNALEDDQMIKFFRSFRESKPSELSFWFDEESKGIGWEIVADNDGLYPEFMGSAAKYEFRIEEYAE